VYKRHPSLLNPLEHFPTLKRTSKDIFSVNGEPMNEKRWKRSLVNDFCGYSDINFYFKSEEKERSHKFNIEIEEDEEDQNENGQLFCDVLGEFGNDSSIFDAFLPPPLPLSKLKAHRRNFRPMERLPPSMLMMMDQIGLFDKMLAFMAFLLHSNKLKPASFYPFLTLS
jgi:hypothetical protein